MAVARLLEDIAVPSTHANNNIFSTTVQLNSIEHVLEMVAQYRVVPQECIAMALALVERLLTRRADRVTLTQNSAKVIFVTALCVAGKITCDRPFDTLSFGMLVGLEASVMYRHEVNFVTMLNWDTMVSDAEIEAARNILDQYE